MKVLIITASFYPINSPRSFRSTELARELVAQGHDVNVLTPYNKDKHPDFEEESGVKFIDLGLPTWKLMRSKGVFTILTYTINKILEVLLEYPDIQYYFKVKNKLPEVPFHDLIISIASPHAIHWGTASVLENKKKKFCNTWIADCGDPFMGARMGNIRKMFWFSYWEKKFCRIADYLTVPVRSAIKAYYPEFTDKIRVIPQGFNFGNTQNLLSTYTPNPVITFCYAGSLSPKRDPVPFMEYLLRQETDFRFYIYTNTTGLIENIVRQAPDKFIVSSFIPREQLLSMMSKMDFVVNIENEVSEQVPSKLIDYYLSGRPILSVNKNTMEYRVVDQFLRRDFTNQMIIENPVQYNIKNVAEAFLRLA